jgi:hypothetical protein
LEPVSGSQADTVVPLPNLTDLEGILIFNDEHDNLEVTRTMLEILLQARKEAGAVPLALQSLTSGPFYPGINSWMEKRWEIRFRLACSDPILQSNGEFRHATPRVDVSIVAEAYEG